MFCYFHQYLIAQEKSKACMHLFVILWLGDGECEEHSECPMVMNKG